MTTEQLKLITHTIEGFIVKDLKFNVRDNIIVGLVKHPIFGKESLRDGFICMQWRTNGLPTNKFKGFKELTLKIPSFDVTVNMTT